MYQFIVNGGRVEINNPPEKAPDDNSPSLHLEPKYDALLNLIDKVGNIQLLEEPKPSKPKESVENKSKKKQTSNLSTADSITNN